MIQDDSWGCWLRMMVGDDGWGWWLIWWLRMVVEDDGRVWRLKMVVEDNGWVIKATINKHSHYIIIGMQNSKMKFHTSSRCHHCFCRSEADILCAVAVWNPTGTTDTEPVDIADKVLKSASTVTVSSPVRGPGVEQAESTLKQWELKLSWPV